MSDKIVNFEPDCGSAGADPAVNKLQ